MRLRGVAAVLITIYTLLATATTHTPTSPLKEHREPAFEPKVHRGLATWYGVEAENRTMANGKRFRSRALTAASRTLPLGTRLRVLNVRTKHSIEVTITDRGPYVTGRVLDLSHSAAQAIDCWGICLVEYEILGETNATRSARK